MENIYLRFGDRYSIIYDLNFKHTINIMFKPDNICIGQIIINNGDATFKPFPVGIFKFSSVIEVHSFSNTKFVCKFYFN